MGSEMCIRDSLAGAPARGALRRAGDPPHGPLHARLAAVVRRPARGVLAASDSYARRGAFDSRRSRRWRGVGASTASTPPPRGARRPRRDPNTPDAVARRRDARGSHQQSTQANEDYFAKNGEPLFSSHMLDLSEDPLEENIATCVEYLERMSKSNLLLEMELGITGGCLLYTSPSPRDGLLSRMPSSA